MEYDEEEVRSIVEFGVRNEDETGYIVKPTFISMKEEVTYLRPYEYIYGKFTFGMYTATWLEVDWTNLWSCCYLIDNMRMFAKADGYDHPFSGSHRMKLIVSIMQEKRENGGCELNLKKLQADGSILAFYPLHNERMIKRLEKEWLPLRVHPWDLPIDEIREYFGEKIGIYFEFLGFYTTWLIPLTIAGVCCFIEIIVRLGVDGEYGDAIATGWSVPMFSLFTSIWSQLFLEYWKRTEVTKAMVS